MHENVKVCKYSYTPIYDCMVIQKWIATIYSYSSDCSPSRQFWTDLNILHNLICVMKGVSEKNFIAITSVVFPVGVTNNQSKN